LNRCL